MPRVPLVCSVLDPFRSPESPIVEPRTQTLGVGLGAPPMRMSHARVQGEPAIANRPGDAMSTPVDSDQNELLQPEPDDPDGDVDDLPRPDHVQEREPHE